MECSISLKNIDFLKKKIAKDLLVINEKGQPWSVDAYIREIYDMTLKATEGQKDNKDKALDAARLVPIFMLRFSGIEPRIRNAIKILNRANPPEAANKILKNRIIIVYLYDDIAIAIPTTIPASVSRNKLYAKYVSIWRNSFASISSDKALTSTNVINAR